MSEYVIVWNHNKSEGAFSQKKTTKTKPSMMRIMPVAV